MADDGERTDGGGVPAARPEGFCRKCYRAVVLDRGGRCRSCKGRQLTPLAKDWAEKERQFVAARYALDRARESAQAPEEVVVG